MRPKTFGAKILSPLISLMSRVIVKSLREGPPRHRSGGRAGRGEPNDHRTGRGRGLREAIDAQKANTSVAETILVAREKAGITQGQIARLVGTTQSVISRLEAPTTTGTR